MPTMVKIATLCGVLAIVLSITVTAQTTRQVAPVPSQVFSAKKVFISNAPGDGGAVFGADPGHPYTQFYAAIKNWGQYDLVSAPHDADLVLELSFIDPIVDVTVTGTASTGASGGSHSDPQLRLVILDPKTRVSLWWLTVHVEKAYLRRTGEKNLDRAVADLVDQLKQLTSKGGSAGSDDGKK